ncbi:unnamed protein product [Prunus armeniaca]|uniref:Uncharacterized protein n=1 Tax=Prunus armeniaca TaxID=36596 RepID=A0A6J5VTC5_PRUAR|nr:unnamed protein product [Prunus armeniaca]
METRKGSKTLKSTPVLDPASGSLAGNEDNIGTQLALIVIIVMTIRATYALLFFSPIVTTVEEDDPKKNLHQWLHPHSSDSVY